MNQKHLDLAIQFNSFAYELVTNSSSIESCVNSLSDDVLLRRVVFNKYYYALYHKYLAYDDQLSQNSGASKHQAVIDKIKSKNDAKLEQTYIKLYNLRIWADYQLDNNIFATKVQLNTINAEVWNIIKRSTL